MDGAGEGVIFKFRIDEFRKTINDFKIKDLVVYEDLKDDAVNALRTRVLDRITLG